MHVLPRDFLLVLIARLRRCLGVSGTNHQKKESGTTADDGLSTRKSSWWCLCYVISGNAADGGPFFLRFAFAVAPSLLLLVVAPFRARRQAAVIPLMVDKIPGIAQDVSEP